VSDKSWPTEADLVRYVDQDLSPEQLERIEAHVKHCSACAKEVGALRTLLEDLAAPLPGPPLDVTAHVAGVMSRLETPLPAERSTRRGFFAGTLAVAAAALLVFALEKRNDADAEFAARGTRPVPSLAREVGVELYAQQRTLSPLPAGSRVGPRTPLTAAVRNAGSAPVYLLLFAIDAGNAVHWIAPEYTVAGTDPRSTSFGPSSIERPLPTAAVFDDLVPGPLRVVAIVTREPRRVSEVETLPAAELALERLKRRFADADVRQFPLFVAP
jgi:putative zinc finger protein